MGAAGAPRGPTCTRPAHSGGLFDVDTGADGALWAVGENSGSLIVLRWNGALFERVTMPNSPRIPPTTSAVITPSDVWIAGTTGQGE